MTLLTDPITNGTTAVPSSYWTQVSRLVNASIFYNPRNPDFGAAIGASAAANTTAFQACINAAPTGALMWITGNGTYDLNQLTISKPLTILFEGWNTVLKLANAQNTNIFNFDSSVGAITGLKMLGGTLDGNAANQTTGGGCVNAAGAVQCLFDHMHFQKGYAYNVRVGGITAGGFGHHNRFDNCLFDGGSSSAGEGIGALINASDENMFFGCDFEDCGGSGGTEKGGVRDEAGLNKFIGCVFVNGYDGIRVKDTGRVRIEGCTFDGVGRDSVIVSGYRCNIIGNTFIEGGSKAANTYSHVLINNDASGRNIVSSNTFTSPTAPGGNGQLRSFVRETGAADNNTVTNNSFHVDGTLGTALLERNSTNGIWRGNNGWRTESAGTTAFGAAVTSVATIAHNLNVTPTAKDFSLQFAADPLAAGHAWVSSITSTTFTLNVKTAPGGAGTTVGWQVQVL